MTSVTADKGYYSAGELQALQREGIRTVINDPIDNRRVGKLEAEEQRAVRAAKRSVKSKSGKDLLRRRGMHIERSFAHILDAGGMRRTTLRGWENLNKRFKLTAAIYNLSQLMRKLIGFGTPKQLAAAMERGVRALFSIIALVLMLVEDFIDTITDTALWIGAWRRKVFGRGGIFNPCENPISSTGC